MLVLIVPMAAFGISVGFSLAEFSENDKKTIRLSTPERTVHRGEGFPFVSLPFGVGTTTKNSHRHGRQQPRLPLEKVQHEVRML